MLPPYLCATKLLYSLGMYKDQSVGSFLLKKLRNKIDSLILVICFCGIKCSIHILQESVQWMFSLRKGSKFLFSKHSILHEINEKKIIMLSVFCIDWLFINFTHTNIRFLLQLSDIFVSKIYLICDCPSL